MGRETVGSTYIAAADLCLKERYPKMNLGKINQILSRRKLDEIESYIHLAGLFEAAAGELGRALAKEDIVMPKDFVKVLLYSNQPRYDADDLIMELKDLPERKKAVISLRMLYAIHNEWVRLNSNDFFDPCRRWQRPRFMPFELIGLTMALKYRAVLDEILMVIRWKVHTDSLRALYWQMQDEFCRKNRLYGPEDLCKYLRRGEYECLSPEIRNRLQNDLDAVEQMAYS